jgi:hypothetical protein
MTSMESFAVLWSDEIGHEPQAGRLELDEDGLSFQGHERVCALRYEDVESVGVARDSKLRLAGRPVLVLELAGVGVVRIGSLGGVGVLSELAERLGRGCRGASPVARVRPRIAVKPTT